VKSRNITHRSRRGPIAGAVALGVAVALVATGCWAVLLLPGSSGPSPLPSASRLAPATIPGIAPTSSPSPSPELTAPPESASPAPSLPPASSYPLVNSCNPASVPGAIAVSAPASGKDSSFVLHVPILMYHRIVPIAKAGNSLPGLVVPPETFTAQLDALKGAGWHTITMATLANDLQARVKPPAKTFVITIDDGWDDGYTYALPILQSHSFVATYFVIAGRIDQSDFLSSAQLQALVAAGDEIGDHTMDHVSLSRQGATSLTYEIDAAAARIAQVTGVWPESLAYPSGGVDNQAAAAVAACQELRIAVIEEQMVSVQPAPSQTPRTVAVEVANETWANRFVVPRIRVTPSTTPAALLAVVSRCANVSG
jgi:peptidoglycan/xylan/chitin deacetylase (PgdA/CDA1 family)